MDDELLYYRRIIVQILTYSKRSLLSCDSKWRKPRTENHDTQRMTWKDGVMIISLEAAGSATNQFEIKK